MAAPPRRDRPVDRHHGPLTTGSVRPVPAVLSAAGAMMVPVPAHTSQALVGRDDELTELTDLLGIRNRRDSDGRHPSVLVSGDAGVGKTRLLVELRDLARAEGWLVYAGHCLDFGESALPYLPFSEVLGRVEADLPDVAEQVTVRYPALTRLRPGRRVRGGTDGQADQAGAEGADSAVGSGPSTDRAELFEAVHALLDTIAAQAPVLIVIEDTHWADQSTRDMLGFLFTRAFLNPVAIVASYRSDDLHRRHPLRRQVAEWSRLPHVERLPLAPLPERAVRELIAELTPGAGLGERAQADIVRRAEGNAFFVEELVASGAGGWVPDDLADLLLVRLDRLSDEARQVVRIASVAGRRVTHDLLAAAAGLPPAELEDGIRQAVEMNVLVAGSRHYSFRHALLGEAVYDDLLPGERVRLHAQYVDALSEGTGRGTAAELALHARRAHDLDRAVLASIEAGDEARAVGGPDEALRHYEQALELMSDAERVERLDLDVPKIVIRAADAASEGGTTQRAVQLLEEHLARLPADGPPAARARLLSKLSSYLLYVETVDDPLALSTEAVSLAPVGESPLRAKILATHARILAAGGDLAEAQSVATEALVLAERLDMPVLASELVTTLGGLHKDGSTSDLRTALAEAVERAVRADALQAELRGRWLIARSHQDTAEWQGAADWFSSAMQRGLEAGLPWAPYSLDARWQLAMVRHVLGQWDEALALVAAVDDASVPLIPRSIVEPVRLAIRAARGEDVLPRLRDLRKVWPDEGAVAVHAAGVEIEALGHRGDAAGALATYDDVVEVLSTIWNDHFGGRVRLAAQTLGALARALPTAPAADRARLAEQATRLHDDGVAVVERFSGMPGQWGVEGQAWAARLHAEHLRVQWLAGLAPPERDDLVAAWQAAVDAFDRFGNVPELAQVRTTYAGILRSLGDTAAAREQGDLAREVAHRLGASVLLDELRAIGSQPSRAETRSQQLTAREREILTLVAEGRSNGEIGRQLFISTKTVSVHVSNILGKLGAAGRTEAAAIARRDGLLG